jgi:4-hydroxy 2-oxovalerate aldolase
MKNMPHKDPTLMDITLKEGGFRVHHNLLLEQIVLIVKELEAAGIIWAEVTHGRGIGAKSEGYSGLHTDEEVLREARKYTKELKYCVYLAPYPFSFSQIEPLQELFEAGRVGVNVPQAQEAKPSLERLKKLGKFAMAQLLRIHTSKPSQVAKAAQMLAEMGADAIYLTDSFGSMEPEEVKNYLETVQEKVSLPLGWQGSNATGLAQINTLTAWQHGASWLDGAINGMGPGSGVTNLEVLVACLQNFGFQKETRIQDLCTAGNFFVKPALRSLPRIRYLDLMLAQNQLDYDPQELLETLAHILDMDLDDFLKHLKSSKNNENPLQEEDLRNYLSTHRLDLDVIMEFLKTGKIP